VRRLPLTFASTDETTNREGALWRVHGKEFVRERPLSKTDRQHLGLSEQSWPVFGAKAEDEGTALALIEDDPTVFFTTPHSHGINLCWSS
jgi:hypothetical protein